MYLQLLLMYYYALHTARTCMELPSSFFSILLKLTTPTGNYSAKNVVVLVDQKQEKGWREKMERSLNCYAYDLLPFQLLPRDFLYGSISLHIYIPNFSISNGKSSSPMLMESKEIQYLYFKALLLLVRTIERAWVICGTASIWQSFSRQL